VEEIFIGLLALVLLIGLPSALYLLLRETPRNDGPTHGDSGSSPPVPPPSI
jgi:hypothetical protein